MYRIAAMYACIFFYLGRLSKHANQESDTHNMIIAGLRVGEIGDKPVSEENRTRFYIEENLGAESEKPLVLQPG